MWWARDRDSYSQVEMEKYKISSNIFTEEKGRELSLHFVN
jgi:hypothetical protein